MDNNENIQFDCNRGCTVTRDANDDLNCTYRRVSAPMSMALVGRDDCLARIDRARTMAL